MKLLREPRLYLTWAVVVLAALGVSYRIDPYLFAYTTFGAATISALLAVLALATLFFSRTPTRRAKVTVAAALFVALVAVLVALTLLRRFHWG